MASVDGNKHNPINNQPDEGKAYEDGFNRGYNQAHYDLNKVNRVEAIDENGRSYVNWDEDNSVYIEIQDSGKTLKIFID